MARKTKAEMLAEAKAAGIDHETDDNKPDLERKLADAPPAPLDPLPRVERQGPLGPIDRVSEDEVIATEATK